MRGFNMLHVQLHRPSLFSLYIGPKYFGITVLINLIKAKKCICLHLNRNYFLIKGSFAAFNFTRFPTSNIKIEI